MPTNSEICRSVLPLAAKATTSSSRDDRRHETGCSSVANRVRFVLLTDRPSETETPKLRVLRRRARKWREQDSQFSCTQSYGRDDRLVPGAGLEPARPS